MKEIAIKDYQVIYYNVLTEYYKLMEKEPSDDIYSLHMRLKRLHFMKKRLYTNKILRNQSRPRRLQLLIEKDQDRVRELIKHCESRVLTKEEIKQLEEKYI
jgi:hypothetical protein